MATQRSAAHCIPGAQFRVRSGGFEGFGAGAVFSGLVNLARVGARNFIPNGTGQSSCGAPVSVEAGGFQPGSSARIELLSQSLSALSWTTTSADGMGGVSAWPGLSTHGYAGPAWIAIDETPTSGTGEAAPATLWDELNVC